MSNKICLSCKKTKNVTQITTTNKIASWKKKRGINSIFPTKNIPKLDNIKQRKPKKYDTKYILKLGEKNSNKYIIYYASNLPTRCSKIPSASESYNNFSNYGISKLDNKGVAKLFLVCPNAYRENNQTYYPHIHFILSNSKNTKWVNKLFTKVITCKVDNEYVRDKINNKCTVILNALPIEYYIKDRIPTSLSLPHDIASKKLSDKEIISYINDNLYHYPKLLKKVQNNKINILDVPIICYCYKSTCNASDKLIKHLNKIGFKNIKEYSGGILDWNKSN